MKKRISKIAPVIVTLFLCACGTKEPLKNENNLETPLPTITSAVEATTAPTTTPIEADLNVIDWTELECEIDADLSRRNSNRLNYGYLTYDEVGNIYFINKNDNAIYVSDADGKNMRRLGENGEAEAMLQKEGDWLYFFNNQQKSINRISIITGEIEQIVTDGADGQFVMEEEKIFTRDEGFCMVDMDGNNKVILPGTTERGICYYQKGNGFWIGNTVKEHSKGYLIQYDGEKMVQLNLQGELPLLAGKYFSIVDRKTQTRHIYNLETKEEVDLNVDTEKAIVSDGTDFYYWSGWRLGSDYDWIENPTDMYCTISKWDGTSAEEIIKIDGASQLYHLFLTPEMLYYQPDFWVDEKQITQLWYYDLKTGETGQIY